MNKKNKRYAISGVARCGGSLVCIIALSACAPSPAIKNVPVTINFIGDCPDSVSPDPIMVARNDKIEWQSSPVGKRYSIHYDPFRGRPLNSNNSGFKRSPPIDPNSPDIAYKYTVIGEGCMTPLDPRIVVN